MRRSNEEHELQGLTSRQPVVRCVARRLQRHQKRRVEREPSIMPGLHAAQWDRAHQSRGDTSDEVGHSEEISGQSVVNRSGGGTLERNLAERYDGLAAVVADQWPRTGKMLGMIADGYRRDATREDHDAA